MSMRSLVEFNHDYAHKIVADPDGFVLALRHFLNGADLKTAEALERFGVTVSVTAHHSDDRHAVVNGREHDYVSADIKRRRRDAMRSEVR